MTTAALIPAGHVIFAALAAPGIVTEVNVEGQGRIPTGTGVATTSPPAIAVPTKKETKRRNSPAGDRRRRVRVTEPI
jgi:hypothetical protein